MHSWTWIPRFWISETLAGSAVGKNVGTDGMCTGCYCGAHSPSPQSEEPVLRHTACIYKGLFAKALGESDHAYLVTFQLLDLPPNIWLLHFSIT